jgi:carnosine N-methyltransferase
MIADPVFADILDSDSQQEDQHSHSRVEESTHSHSHSHSHASSSQSDSAAKPRQAETDLAQDKIRSTLRSFVRDWSDEGANERKLCYDPCLEALQQHWKAKQREDGTEIKVLVPGCGLGRLAMEIAARGQSGRADIQLWGVCPSFLAEYSIAIC